MFKTPTISGLALLTVSSIFALALAEWLIRVFPNLERAAIKYREVIGGPLYEWDPLLGWHTVPNLRAILQSVEYKISVHNNSHGIRGPEYSYTADQQESRILVIGDSFTAGYTVQFEETFGQIAQRKLNAEGSRKYNVIAAGTEAYSTDQELLFFVEEGMKYQPNITVLMFFYNDVFFNAQTVGGLQVGFGSKPLFQLEGQKLVLAQKPISNSGGIVSDPNIRQAESEKPFVTLAIKRWLATHSRLYDLVRRAVKEGISLTQVPLRSSWFVYPFLDSLRVFKIAYDDDVKRAWVLTEALIVQLAEEVARRGSHFILFNVPPREGVYDDEWKTGLTYHKLKDTEWRADQVEVELRRVCAEHHLDCILPTRQFREQAAKIAPKRLYFTNDPHWNREGHELVGKLLAKHIQKR